MNEIIVYNMTGKWTKFPNYFDNLPIELRQKILKILFNCILPPAENT